MFHNIINNMQYRLSIIVPIYNRASTLKKCLDSIINQSMDHRKIEVLMIDDGSTDNSLTIMKLYSEKYDNFKSFTKPNEGLSKTRNFGIKHATGKYIMYLDPDDYLGEKTTENVCDFFDEHYDEVDVVSYKIIPIKEGTEQELHFRYTILKSSGVYDLTEIENSYICHTNINTCVKNCFEDNILFLEEQDFRHEDQKYNIDSLRNKEKIGYCEEAEYYYVKHSDSVTGTLFHAYYIFESTTLFWEREFSQYKGHVPYYIQALFVNDINWKLRSNILLPYHYSKENYSKAWNRIEKLLERCDNKLIVRHPNVKREHILYWLLKKNTNKISVKFEKDGINIFCNDECVLVENRIRIVINSFVLNENSINIRGVVKPLYCQAVEDIKLNILCKNDNKCINVVLKKSSFSRVATHEVTNTFFSFDIVIDITNVREFSFSIQAGGHAYGAELRFGNRVPFRYGKSGSFIRMGKECRYNSDTDIFSIIELNRFEKIKKQIGLFKRTFRKQKRFAFEQIWLDRKKKKVNEIWLYYDCKGVGKDNGYYQFAHDFEISDDIERYYVLNEEKFKDKLNMFPKKYHNNIVQFGSKRHVELFLLSSIIITAFVENYNFIPMSMKEFKKFSRIIDFPRIVYLQHGILHAHTPWKYSLDRLNIDKEVVSSNFEENNLVNNYGFEKDKLICSGMPRYDFIDHNQKPQKRILFAPTWRNYLVSRNEDDWNYNEEKFKQSQFYLAVSRFLNDCRLDCLLRKSGYRLDVKFHPIFKGYLNMISTESDYISIQKDEVNAADYDIFITDFSSYVFDFVYLCRKIIYFVPDYELFKSGMNGYSKLDLPLEDAFGPFVKNEEDAIKVLEEVIKGNFDSKYFDRMQSFFFYKDNNQRERIYKEIINM